jgi:hypothetical protein
MTTIIPFGTVLSLQSVLMRRAIRMMIAVLIGCGVFFLQKTSHSFWVPLTVTIIMQSTIGGTLRKGMQRLVGTTIGIVAAALVLYTVSNPHIYSVIIVIAVFLAYYVKAYNQVSYGIFVVPITMVIVLLLASLNSSHITTLMLERILDTLIGAVIVIICSYLILPNTTHDEARLAVDQVCITLKNILLLMADKTTPLQDYNKNIITLIENHQRIWPEWIYETYFSPKNRDFYQQIVLLTEQSIDIIVALNWYMHRLANDVSRDQLAELLKAVATNFELPNTTTSTTLPSMQPNTASINIIVGQSYTQDLSDIAHRLHQLRQRLA